MLTPTEAICSIPRPPALPAAMARGGADDPRLEPVRGTELAAQILGDG